MLNFFITDVILASSSIRSTVTLLHSKILLLQHIEIMSYALMLWIFGNRNISFLFNPLLNSVGYSQINIQIRKMFLFAVT